MTSRYTMKSNNAFLKYHDNYNSLNNVLFSITTRLKKLTLEEGVFAMVMHLFVRLHQMTKIFCNVNVSITLLESIVRNVPKDMFKNGMNNIF